MANALYPKLALTNLGKNKSTYFPYMLTSIVCIMTYYIMQSIAMNEGLMEVPGAAIAMTIFFLGTGIIAVFCIALMFYTNSFLIKRRKKELGLYCVLGMEKRHVALVLFFETLFTAIACLALGLVFGVLFSKLLFMALLYLLDYPDLPPEEPGCLLHPAHESGHMLLYETAECVANDLPHAFTRGVVNTRYPRAAAEYIRTLQLR